MELHQSSLGVKTILIRLAAAFVCGALVGVDREAKGNPAGLRTHMMVALGACGFTLVANEFLDHYSIQGQFPSGIFRVIGGIIGGVGFLGAGAIIQSGQAVKGLTTAAGIWVVAAIGVACGLGYYLIAGLLVLFSILTIMGGRIFERRFFHQRK